MAVFSLLAAGGLFTYLSTREAEPVEVTVYNEDSLVSEEADAGGGGSYGGGGDAPTYEMNEQSALPQISQTYTEEVQQEQEIKKLVDQGLSQDEATQQVTAEKTSSSASAAANAPSSGNAGNPDLPPGPGNGDTDGDPGLPPGPGHSQGKQPPKRASLIGGASLGNYITADIRNRHVHGHVGVSYTVLPSGGVSGVTVISSSGDAALDNAAVQYFSGLTYEPATDEDGQPVTDIKSSSIDI